MTTENENITGSPMVEEIVELGLRRAIRDSINAAGFDNAKISCYWLGHETGLDDVKGVEPPFVFIQASPATTPGMGSTLRDMTVDVVVVTLPDDDCFVADKKMRDLYKAVRTVFDGALVFDDPVGASGHYIEGSSIDPSRYFQTVSFTVKLMLALNGG